jgi:1,5-anhydro-D-fructose reductase (1,5-anhydro-D-mannitol-forming)
MKEIRWGIIGCGDVTEVKSGPGFQQASGSRLVAVMRRNGALAADYARRHRVEAWYDDARALISDPRVDAIYVATPPGSHLEYALMACAARKPVYVEKPMARCHAECVEMVRAFSEAQVPLFVAYYRRALPRFQKARELVVTGQLGSVTGVSYRLAQPFHRKVDAGDLPWRVRAEESGGGLFVDVACHTLDILDYIFGPLVGVSGTAANVRSPYDVEDSVSMRFALSSGALGTAQWNFASAVETDEIVIQGELGEVRLSTFGREPVELRTENTALSYEIENPLHIEQPMIETVVAELQGLGRCESTGISGARTSAVMDTVLEGYYGSRAAGFWRDPRAWPGRRAHA